MASQLVALLGQLFLELQLLIQQLDDISRDSVQSIRETIIRIGGRMDVIMANQPRLFPSDVDFRTNLAIIYRYITFYNSFISGRIL